MYDHPEIATTTLQEAKQWLPVDDIWAINKMWSANQGYIVPEALRKGEATGISDGFYKNKRDTKACIIETNVWTTWNTK